MATKSSDSGNLELLAQYHELDPEIENASGLIRPRIFVENQVQSYDDLLKENALLKLRIKEYEGKVSALEQYIEELPPNINQRSSNDFLLSDDSFMDENYTASKVGVSQQPSVPPLHIKGVKRELRIDRPASLMIDEIIESKNVDDILIRDDSLETINDPGVLEEANLIKFVNRKGNTSTMNSSPVVYHTPVPENDINSKVVKSPPKSPSPLRGRMNSPQKVNRITAVINNQIHSPMNEHHSPKPENQYQSSHSNFKSDKAQKTENSGSFHSDFDKQTIQSEVVGTSIAVNDNSEHPITKSNISTTEGVLQTDALTTNPFNQLGSPVMLKKRENNNSSKIGSNAIVAEHDQSPSSTPNKRFSAQSIQNSIGLSTKPFRSRKKSNASSLSLASLESPTNIPLFVEPKNFGTIRLEVLSTIYTNGKEYDNEHSILIRVVDRQSDKEVFRFAKTINKIYHLDNFLKSRMQPNLLPSLPEIFVFDYVIPSKVALRLDALKSYFSELFGMKNLNEEVGVALAQFISTDTILNLTDINEIEKEGYILMRKHKTIGPAQNWKVRYGILRKNILMLQENEQTVETIGLENSTVEQLTSVQNDKYGTKFAFQIIEPRKGGLNTASRYFICVESEYDKDQWIEAFKKSGIPKVLTAQTAETKYDIGSPQNFTNNSEQYLETLQNSGLRPNFLSPTKMMKTNSMERDQRKQRKNIFSFKRSSNTSSPRQGWIDSPNLEDSNKQYFDTSDSTLDSMKPHSNQISEHAVFGAILEETMRSSSKMLHGKYEVPSVVFRCLEFLYKSRAVQEEGIFRLSGSNSMLRVLQNKFDKEFDLDLCNYNVETDVSLNASDFTTSAIDVNTVAGLLKLYLRSLPESIFGAELMSVLKKISDSNKKPSDIAIQLRDMINSGEVPKPNVSLLFCIFELLVKISKNSVANKMNTRNLCIVFSPTLNVSVQSLQPFIVDFDCIFNGEQPTSDEIREVLDVEIPQI